MLVDRERVVSIQRYVIEIVRDVLQQWDEVYEAGVKPDNYIGDLLNSLGGEMVPDIGTETVWIN